MGFGRINGSGGGSFMEQSSVAPLSKDSTGFLLRLQLETKGLERRVQRFEELCVEVKAVMGSYSTLAETIDKDHPKPWLRLEEIAKNPRAAGLEKAVGDIKRVSAQLYTLLKESQKSITHLQNNRNIVMTGAEKTLGRLDVSVEKLSKGGDVGALSRQIPREEALKIRGFLEHFDRILFELVRRNIRCHRRVDKLYAEQIEIIAFEAKVVRAAKRIRRHLR